MKEDEMGEACSTDVEIRIAYYVLVIKSERKRPLGKPRCRWEGNIKMHLREIRWKGVNWIHLAQDRGHKMLGIP
jgi:hypothetical protein